MSTNTLTLNYKSRLTIPFGKLQSVLDWCNNNCEKEWNYADACTGSDNPSWLRDKYIPMLSHLMTLDYVFSFESELDHLAFILVHE